MSEWNKLDIGKIIVYRKEVKSEGDIDDEIIAIYGVDSRVPHTIGFINYPIKLTSKFGKMGLYKDKEKEGREYLKDIGDWFYVDKASKEEMSILEKIAKSKKILSDED